MIFSYLYRNGPLPNPLPEGRGDRSVQEETMASAGTDNSLSLKGEGGGEGLCNEKPHPTTTRIH